MLVIVAEPTPVEIAEACGVAREEDAGLVCRSVFRWTEHEGLADVASWVATRPLRIVLILIAAFVVNRLVRRIIRSFVDDLTDEDNLARKDRLRRLTPAALAPTGEALSARRSAARAETIGGVLKSITSIVVYSIATLLVLAELGLDLAPFIAGAGILGAALGFGAQSLVKDFLSGLFMLAEDQYGVGDVVDVGDAVGTVELVNLRTTRLRGVDGTVWHVPNGEIRRVGNMSQQWARAILDVDVAYDTDVDRAMSIVKDVADDLWHEDAWRASVLEEPEVWGVQALGADGITLRLVIKTEPGEQFGVQRELNRRIKDRFDREGVEIPFPQRVMWVRRDDDSLRPPQDLPDTEPT